MPVFTLQDADFDQFATDIASPQAKYEKHHGKSWQGLATPAVYPADDALVAPTLTLQAQGHEDYTDFGVSMPVTTHCSLASTPYDGPSGRGYTVEGFCTFAGVDYQRIKNVGPETYRDTGGTWNIVGALV